MGIYNTESITLSNNGATINFNLKNNAGTHSFDYTTIEKTTFGDEINAVAINFEGDEASVMMPYSYSGIEVTKNGGNVTINSTCNEEVRYEISGTANNGSLTINSSSPFTLALNGVKISNSSFSAINISSAMATIELMKGTTSTLSDGDEGTNGCIFSSGNLKFTGEGTLNISGNKKHAVASKQAIEIESGNINITYSISDGIHSTTSFVMNGGKVTAKSILGDAIDGDTGTLEINGGTLELEVTGADKKALKADDIITINGGNININMPADQGKAIRTKSNLTLNGGNIVANASGNVVVTANDPSYCSIIKVSGTFVMTDGTFKAVHTGAAGKAISTDGNITISGGEIAIEVSGASGTYTNISGVLDSYYPTCISTDADINISGGKIDLIVKSHQAKGFKSNGNTTITGGNITASLSGNAAAINDNPSYCTLIKTDGNFTMSNGSITATHSGIGGKGISADGIITLNGGDINITTTGKSETFTTSTGTDTFKSTCITADGHFYIKNGNLRAVSASNYAIGSAVGITVSGGTTLVNGINISSNKDLSGIVNITGGTFINHSGNINNLTAAQCSAPTVKYASSIAQGTLVTITDGNDNHIVSFKAPQTMSQGCYITHASLANGKTYKLYTGGTISGGTSFNEITNAGNFTQGTLVKSFTIDSTLTNL